MDLPLPIQSYFDADQQPDGRQLLRLFAPDAVVQDEGKSHRGHPAITDWWQRAKQKYDHHAVPFEVTSNDGSVSARAMVTGNFPSSPAALTYTFRLEAQRIAALEITA